MILEVAGKTDIGLVREKNEDYFTIDEKIGLFIVADGLGGHAGGEIASKLAVESILSFFKEKPATKKHIEEAVEFAHQKIIDSSLNDHRLIGMGSTVVFALRRSLNSLYIANVGDARAYLSRDSELKLLTQDHSVVFELFRKGDIKFEEIRTHPSVNIVTQALGIEVDMGPYQAEVTLKDKDLIMLCSDGLWDMLSENNIQKIVNEKQHPEKICIELIEAAKAAGGRDNITVIVIRAAQSAKELKENIIAREYDDAKAR